MGLAIRVRLYNQEGLSPRTRDVFVDFYLISYNLDENGLAVGYDMSCEIYDGNYVPTDDVLDVKNKSNGQKIMDLLEPYFKENLEGYAYMSLIDYTRIYNESRNMFIGYGYMNID